METENPSLTLVTLGKIGPDDVPNNGWEDYRELRDKRWMADYYRGSAKADTIGLGIFMCFSIFWGVLVWVPAVTYVMLFVLGLLAVGTCTTISAFRWREAARELAGLPDLQSVLPAYATPDLAEREGKLIERAENHARNVRRLRARSAPDAEAVDLAVEEERALRSEIGALATANTEFAGLLTDGT